MGFKPNPAKEDLIMKYGETYGLPLFSTTPSSQPHPNPLLTKERERKGEVKMPDWIWTGSSLKAEVYGQMKNKFADDSLLYLRALIEFGGRATDHEIKDLFNDADKWPLHIVSARRNYFTGEPYYIIKSYPNQVKPGPKGKPNTIWFVDFSRLYKIIYQNG